METPNQDVILMSPGQNAEVGQSHQEIGQNHQE